MKTYPIIFSGPMVRAILDGNKTQTRRVAKVTWEEFLSSEMMEDLEIRGFDAMRDDPDGFFIIPPCPFGKPGDLLWVRETFGHFYKGETPEACVYLADAGTERWSQGKNPDYAKKTWSRSWRPSIHMPRWASRVTLEITAVRIERLHQINNNDALAEGTPDLRTIENCYDLRECYRVLWESLHGKASWSGNPWVWVLSFRVHRQNIDGFLNARAA